MLKSRGRWVGGGTQGRRGFCPSPDPSPGSPSPLQVSRVPGRTRGSQAGISQLPHPPVCALLRAHHVSATHQAHHSAGHTSDSNVTVSWAGNVHLLGLTQVCLSVCLSWRGALLPPPRDPCGSWDGTWPHGPHVQLRGLNGELGLGPGSLPETVPAGGTGPGPLERGALRARRPSGKTGSGPEGCQALGAALLMAQHLRWNSGHAGSRHHTLCQAPFLSEEKLRDCFILGESRRNRLSPTSYLPRVRISPKTLP